MRYSGVRWRLGARCAALGLMLFWTVAAVATTQAALASNEALSRLQAADQADRTPGPNGIDWSKISARDQARRKAVLKWLASGAIRTADDYFNAAVIMQHGDSVQDATMALAFATLAARLDPGRKEARQMTAMSWDRLLEDKGQPQWYGTQFVRSARTGAWVLYPVQAQVVSEQERLALGLPSLAEDKAHLAAINAKVSGPGSGSH